jgi:hypothetical protein
MLSERKGFSNVTSLKIGGNAESSCIVTMLGALECGACPKLRALSLRFYYRHVCAEFVRVMLSVNTPCSKTLRCLMIKDGHSGEDGFLELVQGFRSGMLQNLEYLDLSRNAAASKALDQFGRALKTWGGRSLRVLRLSGNRAAAGMLQVFHGLGAGRYPALNLLDVSFNAANSDAVAPISEFMRHPMALKRLKVLLISNNLIGDAGALHISLALQAGHNVVEILDVSGNAITDSGMIHLVRALVHRPDADGAHASQSTEESPAGANAIIQDLRFSHNRITAIGFKAFAEIVRVQFADLQIAID